ncbi:vWA domain-containing protein [Lentibacillus cibarius]|uniref:VWA domain-containing protein n=1 Tax=Lentibacillus cibarius TaxID=2583219 RepID=A0A5S3QG56_9BACI|nr:VWA domain-containing protein [Lentibacillus cibarius]TMN20818.1 VWA domain-containing protein [Lentibacillus cibarius]
MLPKIMDTTESVMNTDQFDKRRFAKLYQQSQGLQNLNQEKVFPTYEALLGDIWAGLYKTLPQLKPIEDVSKTYQTNHAFMERILRDEKFESYRAYTKLDDLASAIGTVQFGKQTRDWLEKQREQDEALDKHMQEVNALQRQIEKQERDDGSDRVNQQLQTDVQQKTEDLHDYVANALKQDHHGFDKAMQQAMEDTQNTKESVKALVGGTKPGSGEAELRNMPLRDQLALADRIQKDKSIQKITEWAGRFKQIARKKQKSNYKNSTSRNGVTLGNNPEQLLPSELALYRHEGTKAEFLRRFAKRKIRQHDTKGKKALGKGPIVLCLDQSGSMKNLDNQAKGFALALMSIAKKQKRDFAFIPFSSHAERYIYKKGNMSSQDMVRLCQHFLGGGTNFEGALQEAEEAMQESILKDADIIFVTDGEDNLSDSFRQKFQEHKKKKRFNVISLLVGSKSDTVKLFSDKVVEIQDFTDEGSFSAFEL